MDLVELNRITPQFTGFGVAKDLESRWIWISQAWAPMLGYQYAEDLQGMTEYDFVELFGEHLIENVIKNDQIAFAGDNWCGIEETVVKGAGSINLLGTKVPLYNESKEICGVFCIATPILDTATLAFINQVKESSQPVLGKKATLRVELVESDKKYQLTSHELEILYFIMRGKTTNAIADLFKLSPKTVEFHMKNIKNKFSCYSKAQLIEKAIAEGYMNSIPRSRLTHHN